MADRWFARVRPDGRVIRCICDDIEPVREGDIPLDPTWYWGRAPGIIWSDPIHGDKYIVENGRLVPTYDNSREMDTARKEVRQWIEDYAGSPILSEKKKRRLPEADLEAHTHVDEAINENEVIHTRKCGY
jgi:hypothetical protein